MPPPLTQQQQQQQNPYYVHYAQPCTLHTQPSYVMPPNSASNCYQHNLPHSKSLDQYDASGKMPTNGVNHHRLSLDSHNYKLPSTAHHLSPSSQPPHNNALSYDFNDAAFNHHPYNQPNVRAPLPYNLSSNLGSHLSSHEYYPPNDHHYYQQLPTPVSEFCQHPQRNLLDEDIMHHKVEMKPEVKLRSSLKKSTHSTSDSLDMEAELNELRALKREKSSTPASTSSDVKTRDGIGNYQAWDYVFQNLEKDTERKKVITADEKIAAELESLKITANGHGPPRDRHSKSNTLKPTTSQSHNASSQTKVRTKSVSVSTTDPTFSHEHKRTSSVSMNESNHKIQMPKPPELIVGKDEWSCRFCTFLNPNSKKICDMCSKSKDFFHDNDKGSTATCVWDKLKKVTF